MMPRPWLPWPLRWPRGVLFAWGRLLEVRAARALRRSREQVRRHARLSARARAVFLHLRGGV